MQAFIIKLFADGAILPVIVIGAWALLFTIPNDKKYAAYCRIIMAGLTAYVLAKLIGSIYQPELERPFEAMGVAARASFLNNPGFPSDHILLCSTITLAVWFETRQKTTTLVLAGLTILVAIGRVLGLVHTPIDVIGAAAIAGLGAIWYLQREKPVTIKPRRHWSKPQKGVKV